MNSIFRRWQRLPVVSGHIVVFRPDLEVIEDYGYLLVRSRLEHVSAVRVARVIARVARRVEFAALTGRAAIGEGATAVGRGCTRYPVFRFESVPLNKNE